MSAALNYAKTNGETFIEELKTLLRMPSVSTDPAYEKDLRQCANWMVNHLKEIGIEKAELIETAGHPIVSGEYISDPARPTILVYGHYDVQPPDPLELWDSEPFEPVIIDDHIFARGACDDKGQMFILLKAVESIFRTSGSFPCNLKFLIEGEEECGSPNVMKYIEANPDKLVADVALVCDTGMIDEHTPTIVFGMRGLLYTEVRLKNADRDLHSGSFGGGVANPIHVLSELVAGLHDENNRITLPGFYDHVLELTDAERQAYTEIPFDAASWLAEVGVGAALPESGYSVAESITARPTLDVNGIWGGYTGEGSKTIIPAEANAKISCRLVPNQECDAVFESLKAYFNANVPASMEYELHRHGDGRPVIMDADNPAMTYAISALEKTFQKKPFLVRSGGSIPVVAAIKHNLGMDAIMMGFGVESDRIHAPNENFGLERFRKGVESSIRFLEAYTATSST